MNNLQPLKWVYDHVIPSSESALHYYDVIKDKDTYFVRYQPKTPNKPIKQATGFATIDDAKEWCWKHYNEKMQPYVKPDSITDIANWFKAAKPEPTDKDICTQLGCHFEEVVEMQEAIVPFETSAIAELRSFADCYKSSNTATGEYVDDINPVELLDALCDQIVTATGVAYMMGFDIEGALKEVIRSNNSKMVKGKFEFDANGKIMKPESYSKPDLTPFVKQGE